MLIDCIFRRIEMSTRGTVAEFEQIINYEFNNKSFIRQALTHSSYANEKRMNKLYNNERLEFLGDAVLELVSSEFLYTNYPNMHEGELTKLRASIVCEPTLALCAKALFLGNFILLGKGEDGTGGRERASILSDALESVIGAIYLDGGFTSAKEFVLKYIMRDIDKKKLFYDSKTILQETVQSMGTGELSYKLLQEEGPDHNKKFTVAAYIGEKQFSVGVGRTKKAAEQEAAYKTLLFLRGQSSD